MFLSSSKRQNSKVLFVEEFGFEQCRKLKGINIWQGLSIKEAKSGLFILDLSRLNGKSDFIICQYSTTNICSKVNNECEDFSARITILRQI